MRRLFILPLVGVLIAASFLPATAADRSRASLDFDVDRLEDLDLQQYEQDMISRARGGTLYSAYMRGRDVVPSRRTYARGLTLMRPSAAGDELHFGVYVALIRNVVGAKIYLGSAGENGEAVATLFEAAPGGGREFGRLASGALTANDLEGPLAGAGMLALIREIQAGNAYAQILTDDGRGASDTGPGDWISGEIRGAVATFGTPFPLARLQVVHNAADPGAAMVDVYINGGLAIDDFTFRTATPYLDLPAGVQLDIAVAGPNSNSAGEALAVIPVTLEAGETYVAFANGVLDPGAFEPNPDGRSTAFQLLVKAGAREAAMDANSVEFFALHGATDAPTVDVIARDVAPLVNDAAYTDITDYVAVPADAYVLQVTPGNDNDTVVSSFAADLSGLQGGAAAVFASGFLNPGQGESFGLFAALPNGAVVAFPPLARLQVIHNAADPGAAVVDIYLGDALAIDDFAFRTATPYIDVPAETSIGIGVAPPTSSSSSDAIAVIPVMFDRNETYVAIANGVLDPGAFEPNPEGRSTAFQLLVKAGAREAALDPTKVEFFGLHGATDAPRVDIIARDVATLLDDVAYTDISDYLAVPAAAYTLDVTLPSGSPTVASFEADLSGLAGGAAVVFASGFLNGGQGEGFGLFAALPNGAVAAFPAEAGGPVRDLATVTDLDAFAQRTSLGGESQTSIAVGGVTRFELAQNRPNPVRLTTTIDFALPQATNVELRLFDISGRLIETAVRGPLNAGRHAVDVDTSRFSSGVYYYRLDAGDFSRTRKMVVTR